MIHPFFRRNHRLIALLMRALVRVLAPRYRVTGRVHLPRRGPVILASSHVSDFDPPVLGAATRFPVVWMAKRELWQISWLGPLLDFFCCFPVDPASSDRAALKTGLQTLARGDALVIFPEGKISQRGELGEIMPGAVMLALKSGAPVVPVAICGAQHIVPYGQIVPRPTLQRVRVHFGAPLRLEDLGAMPSKRARELAAQRLETAMREVVAAARE